MDYQARELQVVRRLVDLASIDTLYADRYLERAEHLLDTVLPRPQYGTLRADYDTVPRLTRKLREAAGRQDWHEVLDLAAQVTQVRARVLTHMSLLRLGDAVYGPHLVKLGVTTLALSGTVAGRPDDLPRARDATLEKLRDLAGNDETWRPFYEQRIRHFGRIQLDAEQQPGSVSESASVRDSILAAVDKGDFAQVRELAQAIVDRAGEHGGRFRIPSPAKLIAGRLAEPFPVPSPGRLQQLELKEEMLPAVKEWNDYLACACADRPTLPRSPLTEARRKAETCTCGHACPPQVRDSLRENLDLLMLHVFVTSGGTRYLPWFGAETILVESAPEADDGERTPLLEMLRLPRRRGLARDAIEDALLSRGGHAVRELGLDPMDFVLVCIPFDAYLRLAPSHGWGREQRWTHFDGYQVCRDLRLRALVGGDARFGGPEDLCSVARDDHADRLTLRFAVVRRQRMTVRSGTGDGKRISKEES